jgi:hypothetical protein
MRCNSRATSFLMKTLIPVSHASFAPFVLYERIIFFLSGHLDRISQQSHKSAPTAASQPHLVYRVSFVYLHYRAPGGAGCRGSAPTGALRTGRRFAWPTIPHLFLLSPTLAQSW